MMCNARFADVMLGWGARKTYRTPNTHKQLSPGIVGGLSRNSVYVLSRPMGEFAQKNRSTTDDSQPVPGQSPKTFMVSVFCLIDHYSLNQT